MVSTGARYGLSFLVALARRPEGADASTVARERGIPEAYLRKIAAVLRKAGLVDAARGQSGGYRLARAPSAIRALDVYAVLDSSGSAAGGSGDAEEALWAAAAAAFRSVLANETVEDLAKKEIVRADDWVI